MVNRDKTKEVTYERKVESAIRLLQSIPQDGPIEICYSTGKDSDVILELAKMAGIPFEAIYKNTSVDRPGSIAHAKEMGATVLNPKATMLELIEKMGWPSRWMRFCCKALKEYKVYDRAVVGIRKSESVARAKRYKEPEQCRVYSKHEKVRQYFPILEWTSEDVERIIRERHIKCHPHYYDEQGNFHVEKRVGCIGCPLQSDKGLADFVKYPKMFKAWVKAYYRWLVTHPDTKSAHTFKSVYDAVYMKMFCNNMEEFYARVEPPLFPGTGIDTKKFLAVYFKIDLTFECHNV